MGNISSSISDIKHASMFTSEDEDSYPFRYRQMISKKMIM